jgi:hypothetical protein
MAADSMVAGLFSTPEQYQQAQNEAALNRGVQLAQLDPLQRAAAQMYQGGYLAGGAIGGALGGQDPQLQIQSFRQQVLRGVDQTDPESLAQASYALNREGDTAGARQLAQLAQEAALKQSQIVRNTREGRAASNKIVEADGRQYLVNSITGEKIADLGAISDKTQTTEAGGRTLLINKATGETIRDLGPAPQRGTNVSVSPEIKMTNQELDWRKQFLSENKPVIEQAANVQQALGLLQQSKSSPFADAAFANTVVSAFGGDKQKSKSEIDRLVKAGSLDERVANTVKGFFEGTTSAKTKEDQLKVLTAVDKVLEQRYNASSKNWSDRLSKVNVNPTMVVPAYNETVGATPAPTTAKLPPEGTRLRNKATNKIEVVRNGKLVPE